NGWGSYFKPVVLIVTSLSFAWITQKIAEIGSAIHNPSSFCTRSLEGKNIIPSTGESPSCLLPVVAGSVGSFMMHNPIPLSLGLSWCVPKVMAKQPSSLSVRDLPQPILGQGYSSDTQAPASLQCFHRKNVTQIKNPSNELKFSAAVSYNEVERSLNIQMRTHVGIGPFQGGASASYLRDVQETAYKVSLNWYEKIYLASQQTQPGYGPRILNGEGLGLYNSSKTLFRIYCGDEIITEEHNGIGLYAALQLQFSARAAKEIFKQSAGGSFGDIVSASESSQSIVTQNQLSGSLSVFAYQQGGNVSQLAEIFGTNSSNNRYVVSCLFGNWQNCQGVITGILNYAENILPRQMQIPHILSYNTVPLEVFGLFPGRSTVNATVVAARKQLGDLYFNQTSQVHLVNHMVQSPFLTQYIPYSTQELLQQTLTALQANLDTLTNAQGVIMCYADPSDCPSLASSLIAQMEPINASLIGLFSQGYRMKSAAYKDTPPGPFCVTIPRCCSAQPGGIRTGWLCPLSADTYQFQTNEDGATAAWTLSPINATTLQLLQGQTNCGPAVQLSPPPNPKFGVTFNNPAVGDACVGWLHPNTCITTDCGCTGSTDVWPLDHNPC
ncbi:MAG: hypothetical protein KGI83_04445, partial [Verrucomicrobiota bacterium]|nr:hypothetical protein [Verrucomicrobiota bacterium]